MNFLSFPGTSVLLGFPTSGVVTD